LRRPILVEIETKPDRRIHEFLDLAVKVSPLIAACRKLLAKLVSKNVVGAF
jgi:hypothetical protein